MAERRPTQTRISAKTRVAITAMVDEGLSRLEAAQKAGITDNWLYQQLRRPEVLALKNERMQVLRDGTAARSISRVDRLASNAESEHVQLKANELLMAIEGISPIARTESVNVHKHLLPGLTIVTGGWSPHQIENTPLVDVTPHVNVIGTPRPHINRIGSSVLHPLDPRRIAQERPNES